MKIEKVTECFYAHIWKHHDLPESLMSDKNTQFTFNIWQHLYQMLKIDVKLFIIYHSETNKQTERINVVMKYYLWVFVNYMQNDWIKWLSNAEFSINNAFFLITLAFPFLANSEQNLCLRFKSFESLPAELTAQIRIKLLNVKKFIKKMKEFTKHLQNKMLIAQTIYKFSINHSYHLCLRYFVEDQVWLNVCNLSTACFIMKLNDWYVSLFSIKHIFKKNSLIIKLEFPVFMKIYSVFYVFLLSYIITDLLFD